MTIDLNEKGRDATAREVDLHAYFFRFLSLNNDELHVLFK